jgi:4-amino-4-deoxy-L-arabinose transferase
MFDAISVIFENISPWLKGLYITSFVLALLAVYIFQKNTRWALFLLFLSSFCIGSFSALLDPFLHLWDEQFHALVAKNLAQDLFTPQLQKDSPIRLDYTNWSNNEIWLHKPPVALWQMSIFIKIFGNSVFAARLPMVLMHAFLIFPIYKIGTTVWKPSIGFFAALIFTFLYYPLSLVSGVQVAEHIDVTFLFYITGSIACWLGYRESGKKRWIVLLGLTVGLVILTKWLVGILVFGGIFTSMILSNQLRFQWILWKHALVSVLIAVLVVAPWFLYSAIRFPEEFAYEMEFNTRHFYEVIENHSGDSFYYWHNLHTLFGSAYLIPIFVVVSVVSTFKTIRKREHLYFLLPIILLPYLFFSMAATKMPSFLVIVSPLIVLVAVAFVDWTTERVKHFNKRTLLLNKLSIPLTLLLLLSVHNPKKIMKTHFEDLSIRKQAISRGQFIQKQRFTSKNKTILLVNDLEALPFEYIQWMFYHDGIHAYPFFPKDLNWTLLKDYEVYQVEGEKLTRIQPESL